jgi:hypothetical protein
MLDWNLVGPIIPDDEPVFLLRAKDITAPDTVRAWAEYRRMTRRAAADVAHIPYDDTEKRAREWAEEMEQYAAEHYEGGKIPDTPEGMLR